MKYRPDIDGLRAFAVVPVVLTHAGLVGFAGGYVGVDIFFVISGFLITSILIAEVERGELSVKRFYERRARRILPALFGVLFFCVVAGFFVMAPSAYEDLGGATLSALLFVSNFWFLANTGQYFGAAAEFEPLLHTWSLGVEEQFYLLFPIFILLMYRLRPAAFVSSLWILCIASFGLSVWSTTAAPVFNFFASPTRFWELGLGALLAAGAFPKRVHLSLVNAIASIGFAGIVAPVSLYSGDTAFPGFAALPPVLGAAALIWSGQVNPSVWTARLLRWRGFVFVGLISYSLYLWHWPILVFLRTIYQSVDLNVMATAFAILLSLILSWLSWRFVERPFRNRRVPFRVLFRFLGPAGAGLVALSIVLAATQGISGRVAPETLAIYEDARDRGALNRRCIKESTMGGQCQVWGRPVQRSEVLLWGDSHAAALLPGLASWAESQDVAVRASVMAGCPPLLGVRRAKASRARDCEQHNAAVIENILAPDSEITTVILHSRWPLMVEASRVPGESGDKLTLVSADDRDQSSSDLSQAELIEQSLERTIKVLAGRDLNIILIEGVPEIGWDVPDALLDDEFLRLSTRRVPNLADVQSRQGQTDAIFDRALSGTNVSRASFVRRMCAPDCMISGNGRALYRDGDHLSIYGSQLLVPQVLIDAFEGLEN